MDDLHQSLSNYRKEYDSGILTEENLIRDPFEQFRIWMNLALSSDAADLNAMTLSTVREDGRPASRIVLLKGLDAEGFVFFTNYESRKGRELKAHPFAALNFFWPHLEKQVRIEGKVEKIQQEESIEYFHSRPRESQIGAWVSQQSSVIKGRGELEQKFTELTKHYEGAEIPKPEYWGGYRLIPDYFEFWQGRPGRLHDRFQFIKENQSWKTDRLSP